jgi:RNA polymerase sigma-70 factor, ECF subfamily
MSITHHSAADDHLATSDQGYADDVALIERLRHGEDAAFLSLIQMYQGPLTRLARIYVSNPALAEDVVQETWIGVLRGIGRFEGRSSLKTWIFRILMNIARTRAVREGRSIPFSSLEGNEGDGLDPERFLPPEHPRWPGAWSSPPNDWGTTPEDIVLSAETHAQLVEAIDTLPPTQQTVITLRDIEGWSAEEVRSLLGISDGNQRVLLHRARTRVRAALERHFQRESVA